MSDSFLLAFSTSTEWCSVGLLRLPASAGLAAETDCVSEFLVTGHSGRLLPMASGLLSERGADWSAVAAIAFDSGPGAFTGLRIGCAVAQGLAYARRVPLIAVSTPEVLAEQASASDCFVVLDARMSECYHAFCRDGLAQGIEVSAIDATSSWLQQRIAALGSRAHAAVAIGSGFDRIPVLREAPDEAGLTLLADAFPRGDALARCALRRLQRGETLEPSEALPLYVRDKVALDVDEQQRARAARAQA